MKKRTIINPEATVTTEKVTTDKEGVRHMPDIVLNHPNETHVLDVAIPWDNSVEAAEYPNEEKRRK